MALRSRYSAAEAAFVDADAKLQHDLLEADLDADDKGRTPYEVDLKTNTRVTKSWGHRAAPQQSSRAPMR
jgi:hypothetical protein